MSHDAHTRVPTRPERLDALPFTRKHGRLLFGSGVGWALDAMDIGLISFIMAALAVHWDLTNSELSWVASIGFVGMAIGASVAGLLADRVGRRNVFALTLLVYGLATGAAAFSTGLAMLLVLRLVIGLGLGGELPVAATLVSEYAPARIRGRVVVILESFWALGWISAALIGYFVVPVSENGWRYAFLIGMVPALYAVYVRWGLPESVRFLEAKGRHDEAEAAVREFEEAAGVAPVDSPPAPSLPAAGIRDVWARAHAARTAALWLVWFGINFAYYGAFIWLPTLLVAQGFDLVRSFQYTLIITLAQLPGYAVAAFLIETWGRRATLASFLAGSAVAAIAFGQADSVAQILVAGCFLSAFNLGAWGALYAVTPEVYPTALRATGSGQAAAFGRLASILAPLSVPLLVARGPGNVVVFTTFGIAFVVAMIAALFLPDHTGKQLAH